MNEGCLLSGFWFISCRYVVSRASHVVSQIPRILASSLRYVIEVSGRIAKPSYLFTPDSHVQRNSKV